MTQRLLIGPEIHQGQLRALEAEDEDPPEWVKSLFAKLEGISESLEAIGGAGEGVENDSSPAANLESELFADPPELEPGRSELDRQLLKHREHMKLKQDEHAKSVRRAELLAQVFEANLPPDMIAAIRQDRGDAA